MIRRCRLPRNSLRAIQLRCYHELSFSVKGEPLDVLEYNQSSSEPPSLGDTEFVPVDMISAPWNPADMNTVQGRYPSPHHSSMPFSSESIKGEAWKVAGSEGLGRVVDGSWVTMGQNGLGTFRSSLWVRKDAIINVERGGQLWEKEGTASAGLFQLGGTALRMLRDFEDLQSGDVILQNAGNSAVGWMVSQLAAVEGIEVISIVRKGSKSDDEYDGLVQHLTEQHTNTTTVVAEEDLADISELKKLQSRFAHSTLRLALNSVGGPSAGYLLRLLSTGGTMVTYGGMSMKPVTVATPQLIFKDLKVLGYWHSRWMVEHDLDERQKMVDELVDLVLDHGVKCPPVATFQLSAFKEALAFESQQTSVIRKKLIFDCREY